MPGGKQRRPGFLLAILLQGKRERKTSQPPGPVRVELTAPDGALWTWGPAEAEGRVTGAAAFSFVTLCSTTLQLHSSPAYRGRIMALWVYVYIGTTPVGSIITGAIISAAGARAALLTGAAACLVAAAIASRVHTPPHADAALTDLASA